MIMAINVKRVGHVGIYVSDVERSLQFYTEVLGCTITNVSRDANGKARSAFLRFEDKHHDFVLVQAPEGLDPVSAAAGQRVVQQIAFEVDSRDDFLRALTHVRVKGVEIVSGPLVHGFEGDGKNFGGSGSRSFYLLDPDGNRLEIYTDMMRVPNGEQFPRQEYADLIDVLKAQAGVE
jgi:catechol 2,3-dioxygenase-like lactoylglutathione lyase family enzyme